MKANLGQPPSWADADGQFRNKLCCERGLQKRWRLFLGVVRRWRASNFRPRAQMEQPVSDDYGALHLHLIHSVEDSSDYHHPSPPVEQGGDGRVASRGEERREGGAQR